MMHPFEPLNLNYTHASSWRRTCCDCLGISPSRSTLDQLLADRPGDRRGSLGGMHSRGPSDDGGSDRGITFPMFLTMMGEHLYDFDADSELLAAFECFDEGDSGFVKCDEIRKWLGDVGERMDDVEVSIVSYLSLVEPSMAGVVRIYVVGTDRYM